MYKAFAVLVLLASSATASDAGNMLWRGVDLSYVNELEDCGAKYHVGEKVMDPYHIFAGLGANVVRLRLWHTPTWTRYSTLDDVQKSIRRAREAGMRILLDLHYSDDWADPGDQIIPAAWRDATDTKQLAQRVYDYTLEVLNELDKEGLAPEFVQVGNEINTEILLDEPVREDTPINWSRNAELINAGIRAVRDFSELAEAPTVVMLHVAQPEYVEPWLDDALAAGIESFDILGLSYYPKWSEVAFADVGDSIRRFREKYETDVVVVETAYPWTLASKDEAGNLLGEDSLEDGYPATIDGQRRFLIDLMQSVVDGGGLGIVYWEPAWISTDCRTRWGQGSHWENAALFHYDKAQLHQGAQFLGQEYDRAD
jgi:arabinogalactan endo-1,4-beta-galactosidase